MALKIGQKVRLARNVRGEGAKTFYEKGREGIVMKYILDCGGTLEDPMYNVIFLDDLTHDGFWGEELTPIRQFSKETLDKHAVAK